MADAILPVLDDFVARGILQLMAQRPSAGPFVISQAGRYFDVFAGWRGQLVLLRRRLVDEARARRLPTADGKALVELCASEFFAELDPEPQTAVGTAILTRPSALAGAGTIKEGTRFRLRADPDAYPASVKEASYVAREPAYVPTTGPTSLTCQVNLIATHSGSEANVPRYSGMPSPQIELADTVFDPSLTVQDSYAAFAAGGSSLIEAVDLRRLARALYTGQAAPTDGALIAGALSAASVKHVAILKDTLLGRSILYIADVSWAYSQPFLDRATQILKNTWLGWGSRIEVRSIMNVVIAVSAEVVLSDPKFGDDTTDLRAIIRDQIRKYLDDRPDFYVINTAAIGGLIAAADPRILTCRSVVVTTPLGLAGVPAPFTSDSYQIYHYVLPDNGVTLTLTAPQ